jgi:hypothetical protein
LVDAVIERAGQDQQANQLLHSMVTDETLPMKLREEAIRELDDEGINEDNPSARDVPIIVARRQVLEAMRPDVRDPQLLDYINRISGSLDKLLAKVQGPPGQPGQ